MTPSRALQSVADILTRSAPWKARTTNERTQADELYHVGDSLRVSYRLSYVDPFTSALSSLSLFLWLHFSLSFIIPRQTHILWCKPSDPMIRETTSRFMISCHSIISPIPLLNSLIRPSFTTYSVSNKSPPHLSRYHYHYHT